MKKKPSRSGKRQRAFFWRETGRGAEGGKDLEKKKGRSKEGGLGTKPEPAGKKTNQSNCEPRTPRVRGGGGGVESAPNSENLKLGSRFGGGEFVQTEVTV